jgi:glycosyltransferase involved in cell wall biosynthesis
MLIHIRVNHTHQWTPDDFDNGLLNGSEEMVFNIARSLVRLGHEVTVQCSTPKPTEHSKVKYVSHGTPLGTADILIAFKSPSALTIPGYEKRYLWTADDTVLSPQERKMCDGLVAISPWHKNELLGSNPGFTKILTIEPGFDRMYELDSTFRINKRCIFASSPDRGLDKLIEMWPDIHEAHPDAELWVTYTDENIKQVEGVNYLGRLTDREMTHLYRSSDLLLYPCTGGERFCITALKAQMYGCIPVVIPKMALRKTVKYGMKVSAEDFKRAAIGLLDDKERRKDYRNQLYTLKHPSWDEVAVSWEELINAET